MASPINYTNGPGGTVGAELATLSNLLLVGNIWYVSSTTGQDAAAPRGLDRARPLATTTQAITNSAGGDWIVYLANHTETFGATNSLAKSLRFVGEGQGSSRPRFGRSSNVIPFDFLVGNGGLHNLYFPGTTFGSAASGRVQTTSAEVTIEDCYFECSANDVGAAIVMGAGAHSNRFLNTTIISTATSTSAQPFGGVNVIAAVNDLVIDGVTFDGGVTGWSNQNVFQGTAITTRFRGTNIDLLRDSDMVFAPGSTGYLNLRNKSGSARITWTP